MHTDIRVLKAPTFLNEKRGKTRIEYKKYLALSGRGRSL